MSGHTFAVIDPVAGISGDMLLGALVDAGAPCEWLAGLPGRLGIAGVTVEVESATRCGVRATRVTVRAPDGSVERTVDPDTPGDHSHPAGHHHGPHRRVGELIELVERAQISPRTKERAVRALRLLAEAEGRVHGIAAEQVALHEVGAYDALVDIVGGIEGFEKLGVESVYALPAALGSGWVNVAHGTLPVPAPATSLLMEGLEVASGGPVTGEATTPTGAVLLRVLSSGPPPARWRPLRTGWGAGSRDPKAYPNALRLVLAEGAAEAASVVLVATDLDDLSPEYLEPLRDALASAGALDVQIWATQMKKGRIGFRVEALAPPDRADAVADAVFRHSTTAGLRRFVGERITLRRGEWALETASGTAVRMKTVEAPGGARTKPEYDDVVALARRTGRAAHEVARELHEQAAHRVPAGVAEAGIASHAPEESE
jgi:uncharacterized protein (TIGR00299 family) protein